MTSIFSLLGGIAQQTTQSDGSPAGLSRLTEGAETFQITIMAMGLCVLAVWIVRGLANTRKLRLIGTPGRPNSLGGLHIVIVLLGTQLLAAAGVAAAQAIMGQPAAGEPSAEQLLLASAIYSPLLLGLGLGVAHMAFRHGIARGMGLSLRRWFVDSVRGVLGVLAVSPVCFFLLWVGVSVLPESQREPHVILVYLASGDASVGWTLLAVAVAAVLAPVTEEVLYRGIFQSALRKWFGSAWWAIAVCSALFATVHLSFHRDPFRVTGLENVAPLFALSLAMGYNYERTGRLWPNIVIHMLFNGIALAARMWP